MCSSSSVKKSTAAASESLTKNVRVLAADPSRKNLIVGTSRVRTTMDDFVKQQKAAVQKTVSVEDRGQFQYTDTSSGDIVRTPELQQQLKAKESTLNIITSAPKGGGSNSYTSQTTSYVVPAALKIKRNWSVKGPGGLAIPSMNTDMATTYARTDPIARKPNVRVVNGKLQFE